MSDKWLTVGFFKSLNLNVPRAWLPQQLDGKCWPTRFLSSPELEVASNNAFKVNNEKELLFFSVYISDPLSRSICRAPNHNDCHLRPRWKTAGRSLAETVEVRGGEVSKRGHAARRANYGRVRCNRGCCACDRSSHGAMPDERWHSHFTEINARFGGGVPLGIATAANSPAWVLAEARASSHRCHRSVIIR